MTCQRSRGKDEGELGSWVKGLGDALLFLLTQPLFPSSGNRAFIFLWGNNLLLL